MTSYLRCTQENWPKIESCPPDRTLHQKDREVCKMTKKTQFWTKNLRFLVVLTKKNIKNDLKLAKHTWTKGMLHENNRTIENSFSPKMSHIIWLKVTKFQQPLLITLRVADEKPEGGGKKPPSAEDRVKSTVRHVMARLVDAHINMHWSIVWPLIQA